MRSKTSRSRGVSDGEARAQTDPLRSAPRAGGVARERAPERVKQGVAVDGLLQKVHRAGLHRPYAGGHVGVACQKDHRQRNALPLRAPPADRGRTGRACGRRAARSRDGRAADGAEIHPSTRSRTPRSRRHRADRSSAVRSDSSSSTTWINGCACHAVASSTACCVRLGAGKLDMEDRPLARAVLGPDAATVRLDDGARNGQPKPHALAAWC